MARTPEATTLADRLTTLIPEARVLELAKKHGAVERFRKVDIYVLVWSLVLGFQTGSSRSLAALHHLYNKNRPGKDVVRSSFHGRLTEGLARLLRALTLDRGGHLGDLRAAVAGRDPLQGHEVPWTPCAAPEREEVRRRLPHLVQRPGNGSKSGARQGDPSSGAQEALHPNAPLGRALLPRRRGSPETGPGSRPCRR